MLKITVPQYPVRIQMTKSRRAKYYKAVEDLPKTWKRDRFGLKGGFVYNLETGERVIKNSRSVGTPRYQTLSGNSFWAGFGHPSQRAILARALKDGLKENMIVEGDPLKVEDFPLQVFWKISKPTAIDFDISNLWFYYKMLEDCLVDLKIIPNDTFRYISWLSGPKFETCSTEEEREIVLILRPDPRWTHDTRPSWEENG